MAHFCFWPWSLAAFAKCKLKEKKKNLSWNWIRSERQGCHFSYKAIQLEWTNQCNDSRSSFYPANTLSNDSTSSTLDQPLWNLLKANSVHDMQLLPTCSHLTSSSRQSHQLLAGPTAAAYRCRLIKYLCLNAELPVGRACKIRRWDSA